MVPTAWQDEALAHEGVSREVPCSALNGETAETPPHVLLQMGPVSLFHPLKATLEQTQPAVLRGARVFLRQKSSASLSNGGAV